TAEYCCVYWGSTIPPGSSQVSDYHHMISAGTGCYEISDFVDPNFDYTPGDNFYHPQNTVIATGADDGSEMGCFGGPDGGWTPPSQIYN
ncbi:hypothetical protein J7L05_05350, partial [bacterium]|nr:hypothetical protein [bacterium]